MWRGEEPDRVLTFQREVERFEATIVAQAQRLQAEGKTGLKILPGVHDLLTVVSGAPTTTRIVARSARS